MFGFNFGAPKTQCGVVIDIGSGSVGCAIIVSNVDSAKPEIIWSHREYARIKDITSTKVPLQEITTALTATLHQVGNNGSAQLRESYPHLKISVVQATVSAPWTYTTAKTIHFTDDKPFKVNTDLIAELSETVERKILTEVLENDIFKNNQLEIIDNKVFDVRINGYPVANPRDIRAKNISIAHITAITQKKIIQALTTSVEKILPKSTLVTHSFMYMFYDVLKNLNPDTAEVCLIDVTSEATEVGIVREGVLVHVTNVAFGTFSLAREIAAACKIPKEEAYSYLKEGMGSLEEKLSKVKLAELHTILKAYEDKIAELFSVTGDTLAIPKTLFLHCETSTEAFFMHHLVNAAKKATTMRHGIHPITSLFFGAGTTGDTGLLLSAHFFHRVHKKTVAGTK